MKTSFNDSFSQYFLMHEAIESGVERDSLVLKSRMKRIVDKMLMMKMRWS
mgnify:CR=1 FL=1